MLNDHVFKIPVVRQKKDSIKTPLRQDVSTCNGSSSESGEWEVYKLSIFLQYTG